MNRFLAIIFLIFSFGAKQIYSQSAIDNYFQAIAAIKYGNPELALQKLQNATVLSPNDMHIHEKLGDLYFLQNDFGNAVSQYKLVYENGEKTVLLKIARAYSMQNNADSSTFFLKKYLNYYDKLPKSEIITDSAFENVKNTSQWELLWKEKFYTKPQLMLSEAQYVYKYSDKFDALDKVDRLLKQYKKYSEAYFFKAQILSQLNADNQAIKVLTKAIEINPRKAKYYLFRADEYMKLSRFKKAVADYNQYLKLNPYDIFAYPKRSAAFEGAGQYSNAIEDLSYYLKYFAKDDSSEYKLAQLYYDNHDYLSTIKIVNLLFEKNPHNADYYYLRALAYMNSQMYKLSFHDFSQVLDLSPEKYECYYYRGIVDLKMNKIQNACADWSLSIKNHDYRANDYFYQYCKDYHQNK